MAEIAYVIDAKTTQTKDLLAITLIEVEPEGYGYRLLPSKPFSQSALKRLTTPKDQAAVDFLIKEELQFQRQQTGRSPHLESLLLQTFHIGQMQAVAALKLMAATQKLYFNGKQLVADFYDKVDFYYQAEELSSQQLRLQARLKWKETAIALQACELVGPGRPNWFIKGICLKLISTSISWKQLKRCYEKDTWLLEGAQKQAFLNEIDPDDPESPQLVSVAGASLQSLNVSPDPFPFLQLKDRHGAFADLWMDYGQGYHIPFHHSDPLIKNQAGQNPIKRRPEEEKKWEKDLLETDFIKKDTGSAHYYCPLDKVAKSLTFLLEIGWQIIDWKGNRVVRQKEVDLSIDPLQHTLLIKGKVHYDSYEADLHQVLGAFNRKERFIQLSSGTVGLLPAKWQEAAVQTLAEEGEIVGDSIRVKKSHLGALEGLFETAHVAPVLSDLQTKLKDFTQIETVSPSSSFQGTLRPYQQQGLNWLAFLVKHGLNGILADDMGLGKTVQVLALLSTFSNEFPCLIVVPTSLLFNWKKEMERFLPQTPFYVHEGPKRARTLQELSTYPVILTSYHLLRSDLALFQSLSYQAVILDEAQAIKNAHTQIAQALFNLKADFRLSMTGTPLENHLRELWSHFRFLIPDLFGEESTFLADLQAAESDARYLQKIKRKIAPFILRRKKEEVAKDLPERIDQIVWIEMGEAQRELYERFIAETRSTLLKKVETDGIKQHRMEIFEAILRLRQICCHPLLLSSLYDEAQTLASAKFEAVLQDLETAIEEKRKVLVYSQFTSMLHLLSKAAKSKGWSSTYLDGSTTDREKVVTAFQEDPNISLFFISLKAGGVGLNLTAADYVFLYDPWWNEAVEEQAIGRAHRIGRKETVIAKRFTVAETIEEKMIKLKAAKRLMVEEVIEEQSLATHLTIEDLRYLLS